jgi:hypothetical protein
VTTARAITLPARLGRNVHVQSLLVGVGVVVACLLAARMLTEPRELRLAVVGTAVTLAVGLSGASPIRLLFVLPFWLTALGFLRRTLNVISPTPHADPLLLVGPLAIAVLFLAAAKNGAFRERSRLASAVLALNVLTLVGAFNPLQGSLAVGFAGLLFVLVPTLAFWIGRGLCDDRIIGTVLKLFAVLSIPVAVYGLAQTFAGFPFWDSAWITAHKTDYGAISVSGVPRAFASFSASSEYATFLAIGLVVWIAFGLTPALAPIAMGAIAMLAAALFFEGSRGAVIGGVVALGMMAGSRAGVRLKWSLALAGVLVLLVPYAANRFLSLDPGGGSPVTERQVRGLQNPTNSTSSTLGAHVGLVEQGVRSARAEPLGKGTGAVTIAGMKFGSGTSGTEADPGNVAVAFGIPGLIVYFVIVVEALRSAYRLAFGRRKWRSNWLAPAALAIVVLSAPQWLNGGQYAVAFLPWLLLGWIDRSQMKRPPLPPESL